jgi:transposase
MAKDSKEAKVVVGMDVGDRLSELCFLEEDGEVVERGQLRTTENAMRKRFAGMERVRIVLEVGTHSPWLSRLLEGLGHEVVVANAHRVQLIARSTKKTDRNDAETLARLGRADVALLSPVRHRSVEAQATLAVVRSREALVHARTLLINQVRGTVKSMGRRLPASDADSFHEKVGGDLPPELRRALGPVLTSIEGLTAQIRELEKEVERLGREHYPETAVLRQIPGVGPITALTFVATIGDPSRFRRSREIGAYLGLTPKQRQSGERAPELGITRSGDRMLRSLLVQCAHYVLGYRGPDSDLRRWGLKQAAGGAQAKKRALVAVARKLAVLLHRLWVTGLVYEPLRNGEPMAA